MLVVFFLPLPYGHRLPTPSSTRGKCLQLQTQHLGIVRAHWESAAVIQSEGTDLDHLPRMRHGWVGNRDWVDNREEWKKVFLG